MAEKAHATHRTYHATNTDILGWGLVIIALLLLYFLNKKGLLHESVSTNILTPDGTTTQDPVTGYPQYDTNVAQTVPSQIAQAVAPIYTPTGEITSHPPDPTQISCPIGTSPWHNVTDDSYWCLPT